MSRLAMSRLALLLAAGILAAAPLAEAGTPVTEEAVCPVDGKAFETTGTMSCSHFGATMALRRITSCDFVTVLPTCPGSGFPVYRPFDEAASAGLAAYVETPDYKALAERSRFYRAWMVETWLAGAGHGLLSPSEKFGILITGLAHEPRPGIADADYREVMLHEAGAALPGFSDDDRPFIRALVAFIELRHGERAAAAARLDRLEEAAAAIPYLKVYVGAIRACLADETAPTCDPMAPIPR